LTPAKQQKRETFQKAVFLYRETLIVPPDYTRGCITQQAVGTILVQNMLLWVINNVLSQGVNHR